MHLIGEGGEKQAGVAVVALMVYISAPFLENHISQLKTTEFDGHGQGGFVLVAISMCIWCGGVEVHV
jgi:hypothetical protein